MNDRSSDNPDSPENGFQAPTPLDSPTGPAEPAGDADSSTRSVGAGAAGGQAGDGESRFNPLVNESDMFKVLIGVVIFAAVALALVLVGRAVL